MQTVHAIPSLVIRQRSRDSSSAGSTQGRCCAKRTFLFSHPGVVVSVYPHAFARGLGRRLEQRGEHPFDQPPHVDHVHLLSVAPGSCCRPPLQGIARHQRTPETSPASPRSPPAPQPPATHIPGLSPAKPSCVNCCSTCERMAVGVKRQRLARTTYLVRSTRCVQDVSRVPPAVRAHSSIPSSSWRGRNARSASPFRDFSISIPRRKSFLALVLQQSHGGCDARWHKQDSVRRRPQRVSAALRSSVRAAARGASAPNSRPVRTPTRPPTQVPTKISLCAPPCRTRRATRERHELVKRRRPSAAEVIRAVVEASDVTVARGEAFDDQPPRARARSRGRDGGRRRPSLSFICSARGGNARRGRIVAVAGHHTARTRAHLPSIPVGAFPGHSIRCRPRRSRRRPSARSSRSASRMAWSWSLGTVPSRASHASLMASL